MTSYRQINFDSNQENLFTISVKRPPKFAQVGLIITILISLLIPIIVLTFMLINHAELKIGIFVLFGIFGLISVYLFRVWSWNQNGKEIFEIGNEEVKYYADFKYFKGSKQQIDKTDLKFEINELIDGKEKYGQLLISNDSEKIESCIKVEPNELKELIERLKNYA